MLKCLDEGIILEKRQVDKNREYYCEYMTKDELDITMDNLAINDPVDRFYHFKKFKYLP